MVDSVFRGVPDRIRREDVPVMEQTTVVEVPAIRALWSSFEELVGLRGRKMYARVDERAGTYTVCTPLKPDDRPDLLGLQVGVLPGGVYLRGRLVGNPPEIYERIPDGMAELKTSPVADGDRPLVEFYRRSDVIELWLPIAV